MSFVLEFGIPRPGQGPAPKGGCYEGQTHLETTGSECEEVASGEPGKGSCQPATSIRGTGAFACPVAPEWSRRQAGLVETRPIWLAIWYLGEAA